MLWVTSDWHFGHNKSFVYEKRGFKNIYTMNEEIVKRHNELVKPTDRVFFLGDAMLGDVDDAIKYIRQLNGQFYFIFGNHDTDKKRELLKTLPNWIELGHATVIKESGLRFYLSHYPTMTADPSQDKKLKSRTINLYGHTHQNMTSFYNNNPYMYHCGIDSHDCKPVSVDEIIYDIKKKEGNL